MRNIIAFAILSLVEALQLLIIVALVYSFIPYTAAPFVSKLFPINLYDVHMERETFFYHLWIGAALLLQGLLMFIYRRRLEDEQLWRGWLMYTASMAVLIVVQVFALFKVFLWGNPSWARDLFYGALGIGILARIFWPETRRVFSWSWGKIASLKIPAWGYLLLDALFILIMAVLIFAPNLNEVLARMFSYDKFYHLDSFIMSPAWAHHHGLVLNKDVNSEYSLIIPIAFDSLMRLAGGFSYAHAVSIMILLTAGYYLLLYGLWRCWLGSIGLAVAALLVCLKLQFFHWGVIPLIWIYPSATPLRFLPDVFFLFCMVRFTQTFSLRWLFGTALVSGTALVWTLDVGVYMFIAFLVAAAAAVYQRGRTVLIFVAGLVAVPWLIAFGILSVLYGTLVWQHQFWQNTFEFASLFMQGWGVAHHRGFKGQTIFCFLYGVRHHDGLPGEFIIQLKCVFSPPVGRLSFDDDRERLWPWALPLFYPPLWCDQL